MENNDCDVNASCGIQQWELDNAAATKQQIYLDDNRNTIPRNKAEVALAPAEVEANVRSAVMEAVQQVSLERAPLMGPRGAPTTCLNQHGALQSYSFSQI